MNMNTSNFITLIGRLGDAPKTVTLQSGIVATEFSLATNDHYRDRDGNKQTRTDWHKVKAYGRIAELFDQYLDRGKEISIVGSMQYSKWTDKHDQPRTTAEVYAHSFSFIGSGSSRQPNDQEMPSRMVAEPASGKSGAKNQRRRERTEAPMNETVLKTADRPLPF